MAVAPQQEKPMFAKALNGLALPYTDEPITWGRMTALELQAESITTLNLPPLAPADIALLAPLLDKRMPFLEELSITYDNPCPFDPSYLPPKFYLSSRRFPYLRTLRIRGIVIDMAEEEFFRKLRHLELRDYANDERCLPFTEFMHAMDGCHELETLEIRNYGRIFDTDTEEPEQPAVLRSLRKLVIEDTPPVLALLIKYLSIPQTANVHLIVDMSETSREYDNDFGDTFAYVLSDDTHTLSFLPEITAIEVNLIGNTYQFVGETPLHNKLVIDIDMDAVIKQGSPTKRAELFDSTVRNLGLALHESTVMIASLKGDLSGVTRESWHRGLRGLRSLMKVEIVDTSTDGDGDGVRAFFEALVSPLEPADGCQKMVCTSLESIAVGGATYSRALMEAIGKYLHQRAEGGAKLRSLWVELRPDDTIDRIEFSHFFVEYFALADVFYIGS
ncbi:hypothetical protein GY45DRAFT_1324849 [Cubamyces sp. BRFM 1775]|nr:hypothetical protein GY45DRAFT_1324849 [Cubamyces sp. BRFM 1775]